MSIFKHGYVMNVSREMALDHGLIEPTPEEAAERKASSEEWAKRRVSEWAIYDAMRLALDALTDPTIRAVLDLHSTDDPDWPTCRECHWGDDEAPWPCATVKAIAGVREIAVPDIDLWRRP